MMQPPFIEDPGALTLPLVRASWRKYLEYLLHNGIHVWIGGATADFSDGGHMTFPPVAINDPVFWLHHANVDRLWAIWQQHHPGLGYVPQAGADAGHNGPDTMALFNNPAHFAFPLAPRPNDVLDWHSRGIWYASDLPLVTPRTLSVNFGDVPENLTTQRPIQFDVRTCQRVKFRITAISAGNFSLPADQGTVVVEHSPSVDPVLATDSSAVAAAIGGFSDSVYAGVPGVLCVGAARGTSTHYHPHHFRMLTVEGDNLVEVNPDEIKTYERGEDVPPRAEPKQGDEDDAGA
jgi:Common central domain of tyrosinase